MFKKVIVLGVDGATIELLNRPELPNFQRVLTDGITGTLLSRPAITSVAWPSMVSGVNAGKHGIFDFRRGDELLLSDQKKAKELWDYLPSIAINIPMSYPVKPIDGVMIGDMMTPDLDSEGFVYPESEREYLKSLDYIIEPEIDLISIEKSVGIRIEVMKHYLKYNFELFFIVFREYDSLWHFFFDRDLKALKMLDQYLDELISNLPQDTALLIVSDHGFTRVNKSFNVQEWLDANGFSGQAWEGGWGAIYLDKIKDQNAKCKIKEEIIKNLKNFTDQGQKVLDVYPQEEIYNGPEVEKGPDIVISPKRELGYTFGMRTGKIIGPTKKTGCHLEKGVVSIYGQGINPRKIEAKIFDIFPTIFKLLGEKIPDHNLDGKAMIYSTSLKLQKL